MVSLIVGFPGSGKSYYAIDKIYNILTGADKMSNDIDVIYTNINGVKFDLFPDSKVELKKFNIDDFSDYLVLTYASYQNNKNDDSVDDELIEISKKYGFYRCLIVFDECHDFFSKEVKEHIFWLTYHRHLYHEIILLTQNKTLINSKYRAIPEIFIEAQPRSKKLFNSSLSYKKYAAFGMTKKDLFDKQSIKTRNEVFALYQSGNKSNQKSILTKYIFIIVSALVLSIGIFYYLLNSFKADEPLKKIESIPVKSEKRLSPKYEHKNKKELDINNNEFVIKITCDTLKGCIYKDNIYSIKYIHSFITKSKATRLEKNYIFQDKYHKVFDFYILTTNEKLRKFFINIAPIIKKRVRKELKDYPITSIADKVRL